MINPIDEMALLPDGAYTLFRQQVICSKAGSCQLRITTGHCKPHAALVCPIAGHPSCPRTDCVSLTSFVVVTEEKPA